MLINRIFDPGQWQIIIVSTFSPILAIVTPTEGFLLALVIAFGFNIFCGMRADGVSIVRCVNFKWAKVKNALAELLLYTLICYVMYGIVISCNDYKEAIFVIKILTYIFSYLYIVNGFKNLIIAYPKNIAFRVIYYLLRFEFTKALPTYWKPIIDRISSEIDNMEKKYGEQNKQE